MYTEDTIAAIATPPGIGGVGIIRISGKEAFSIVNSIFVNASDDTPLAERQNKTIQYGHIKEGNQTIDEVLLLLMKGPHSYTAEDVVEIQCHGGIVPIRKILEILLQRQVRLAEPGEFTRRAFLNGRIDLTQAEAIIDIIEAKTERALELAVNQLDGTLSTLIRKIRQDLIELIAHMEVTIDYPEEDIEDITSQEVNEKLKPIRKQMEELLETAHSGRLLRDGIKAVIIGVPNAGKSSLMNSLLRENRAIVTDIPGTTRDSLAEYMNIEGITLHLIDTAGIRETKDVVEELGVKRAKDQLEQADMVLCVIDSSTPLTKEEKELLAAASGKPTLVFLNKRDLVPCITVADIAQEGPFVGIEPISAADGEGLPILTKYVKKFVYGGNVRQSHDMMLGNIRHIELMKKAKAQLDHALEGIDEFLPIEFTVTDMREAWVILGEITGDSLREELTDELFSRFCLGK